MIPPVTAAEPAAEPEPTAEAAEAAEAEVEVVDLEDGERSPGSPAEVLGILWMGFCGFFGRTIPDLGPIFQKQNARELSTLIDLVNFSIVTIHFWAAYGLNHCLSTGGDGIKSQHFQTHIV